MCASAIVWSGLQRVIYGVSIDTLVEKGESQIVIPCRELFGKAERSISVEGPLLEKEGLEVFEKEF
jgi:tRNA(Arg) A34 adenosine deaminase TadA